MQSLSCQEPGGRRVPARYQGVEKNSQESEHSLCDPDVGHYKVAFGKVRNGTSGSVRLINTEQLFRRTAYRLPFVSLPEFQKCWGGPAKGVQSHEEQLKEISTFSLGRKKLVGRSKNQPFFT